MKRKGLHDPNCEYPERNNDDLGNKAVPGWLDVSL